MKRQISFILVAAVLLALSLQACKKDKSTGPFGGSGTQSRPYLINNAADLNKLSEVINNGEEPYAAAGVYYRLNSSFTMPTGNFTPIGTGDHPFQGTFDGNNKIITNLAIIATSNDTGLFGYVEGGKISNLGLANVNINGRNYVGGIAGYIINSYFASINSASISGCYVTGKVSGSGGYVGGIAGFVYRNATVSDCYTTCIVGGVDYIGGIAGWVENNSATVSHCYATGAISGEKYCGGIVGANASSGIVNNNAALNQTVNWTGGDHTYFGRVVGWNDGMLVDNAAYEGMTTNSGASFSSGTGTGTVNGLGVGLAAISLAAAWTALGYITPPWTVQNNKLPGLFGNTVAMPEHIK